ncbi:MAG TPA: hypothetical protein PKN48_11670 [Bacteroidales bacterium]|nr:hypothetical protein [Bacteroidales bacterium]
MKSFVSIANYNLSSGFKCIVVAVRLSRPEFKGITIIYKDEQDVSKTTGRCKKKFCH